jgi:hypothetical protein
MAGDDARERENGTRHTSLPQDATGSFLDRVLEIPLQLVVDAFRPSRRWSP